MTEIKVGNVDVDVVVVVRKRLNGRNHQGRLKPPITVNHDKAQNHGLLGYLNACLGLIRYNYI